MKYENSFYKPNRWTSLALASCLLGMCAEHSLASDLSVTSDAPSQKQASSACSTQVFTEKDIAQSGSSDLYDFLDTQTSLSVLSNYGNDYARKIDMLGYGTTGYQNIVITVDGRQLNNIDMAPQILSTIPLSNIQEIEITKGASITKQGDGATAGSIAITTKKQTGWEIGGEFGSYDASKVHVSGGFMGETFHIHANASTERSDGNRDIDEFGRTDEKQLQSASLGVSHFPNSWLLLEAGVQGAKYDMLYPNPLSQKDFDDDPSQMGVPSGGLSYTSQEYDERSFYAKASVFPLEGLEAGLQFIVDERESTYLEPYAFNNDYDYQTLKTHLTYQENSWEGTLGIDLKEGTRQSGGMMSYDMDKDNLGFYAEGSLELEELRLMLGVRHEEVDYRYQPQGATGLEKTESENAFEIGVNYQLNDSATLFANYSRAFQTPDVDRFFNAFTNSFNGYIDTMKTQTYQSGVKWNGAGHRLMSTLFYVLVDDEIYYESSSWTNTNLDETRKAGWEITDRYDLDDQWTLSGSYTYLDAKIEKGGPDNSYADKKLPGVSKHNLNLAVQYRPDARWLTSISHAFRSDAYAEEDFLNDFAQKQKEYHSTNLKVAYRAKHQEWYATITNLFDRQNGYWVRDDTVYPTDFEREFRMGLKFSY